jgi:hypothetical protein
VVAARGRPRPGAGRRGDPAVSPDRDPAVSPDDGHDARLAEHEVRALVGVVDIHRDVCRTRAQDPEDSHVEVMSARRGAHPDLVPATHADGIQPSREVGDVVTQIGVGQD